MIHTSLKQQAIALGATYYSRAFNYGAYHSQTASSVHFFRDAEAGEPQANGKIEIGMYIPMLVSITKKVVPMHRANPLDSVNLIPISNY